MCVALVALVVSGASCIPIQLSPECQAQISDCLKDCRDTPIAPSDQGIEHEDTRNECERYCHSICGP